MAIFGSQSLYYIRFILSNIDAKDSTTYIYHNHIYSFGYTIKAFS